jgi:3-oxoacyl-[acyl-carrier protein] reductase
VDENRLAFCRLEGQVGLVTGASRGIGKAIARVLGAHGARVYLSSRNAEVLESAAEEIRSRGGKAVAAPMDIRDNRDVARAVKGILEETSRIDILVNNAGVRNDRLLVRTGDEAWQEVLETNLSGTFFCMRQVIPAMSRNRYGRIVNITSVVGFTGNVGQANYAAAKAGIVGLTKSAAREYARRGITVNAVAPGFIETAMAFSLEEKVQEQIREHIPMGRLGSAEEVACAVAFLVSPEASYITGQVLHVNGGLYV